jgi:hypothetical protein
MNSSSKLSQDVPWNGQGGLFMSALYMHEAHRLLGAPALALHPSRDRFLLVHHESQTET